MLSLPQKRHIQYTCNNLKKVFLNLELLKEMTKQIMEIGDGEKLKGKMSHLRKW